MKKLVSVLLAAALTATAFTGCASSGTGSSSAASNAAKSASTASSKSLNIFTWDGYIPQDVLDGYTAKTGVKINMSNFESNEEMLTKLQAAKGGSYDIVIASDYIIDIARKKGGLLSELDKTKIPNYKNIDPTFQSQYYDSKNQYTVPYIAGTPLIVYDPAVVKINIKGYADLWNPALKNSVVAMDDGRNIIGITLKTLGKSFNEMDKTVLEQARKKLLELKPNIRALSYDNPQSLLISGEASVGYLFTAQAVAALAARPDLKVVYPSEGMGFGIDNMFVPAKAPDKDNAYSFIDYALDAKVGAKISSQVNYLCPNKASQEFLPASYKSNKSINVPTEILGKTEFIKDVGDATSTFDKIWTEFKQK